MTDGEWTIGPWPYTDVSRPGGRATRRPLPEDDEDVASHSASLFEAGHLSST